MYFQIIFKSNTTTNEKFIKKVPENAGINDDSQTASMKEREDTQIDNSSISDALTEKSNEVPSSFYDEKAHQGTSTKEGNEVDVNEDKTDYQEYNNISESIAEEQNQEKENETELTKNVEVTNNNITVKRWLLTVHNF